MGRRLLSKAFLRHTEDRMRTPLSIVAAVLAAAFLAGCQAGAPSAPIDELPHDDPTEASTSLADSPPMGGTGSQGSGAHGGPAPHGPACMHGDHPCSTDKECCSQRCVQAGSATGRCER